MPKTRAATYYGAGDYGREQFKDILRAECDGKPPKGLTWAKFMKYMEDHPEEIVQMCGVQEQAADLLWWGMRDAVARFVQHEEDEAPE